MQFHISYIGGKEGWKVRESSSLEFLKMISAINFALLDAEVNFSGPLNGEDVAVFSFLKSLLVIYRKLGISAKLLGINWLFCFLSISKFGRFKNLFVTITTLAELHFRCRRYILLVSMNYGSSTSSWKPWR